MRKGKKGERRPKEPFSHQHKHKLSVEETKEKKRRRVRRKKRKKGQPGKLEEKQEKMKRKKWDRRGSENNLFPLGCHFRFRKPVKLFDNSVVLLCLRHAQVSYRAQLRDGHVVIGFNLKLIEERADFAKTSSPNHSEVKVLRVLVEKAHTASAMDAAIQDDTHVRVEVEVFNSALVLAVPTDLRAIVLGNILQVAVCCLLANGAIVWMVHENELDVTLAGIAH